MAKKKAEDKRVLPHVPRSISRTRQDIKDYVFAVNMWKNVQTPRTYKLQNIYEIVAEDDMVLSQSRNRKLSVFSRVFVLKNADGTTNEEATKLLKDSGLYRQFVTAIQDAEYYDYTLAELEIKTTQSGIVYELECRDRKCVVPQTGEYFPDYGIPQSIKYRELKEFGTYIYEFKGTTPLGLLNACTPKALLKKFTLSCWAELAEIYGIPPRVMKTNTQDKQALDRADGMMRDMGAAAYFIIDETEEFEFAQGVATNGDVYDKLISKCDNAIQNIITGAIVGQDTKNGSNSKEKTSQEISDKLVEADLDQITSYFNNTILKGLYEIGFFKQDNLRFEYEKTEDIDQLWAMIKDLLPYKDFDVKYLFKKFGIEALDKVQTTNQGANLASALADFFV